MSYFKDNTKISFFLIWICRRIVKNLGNKTKLSSVQIIARGIEKYFINTHQHTYMSYE